MRTLTLLNVTPHPRTPDSPASNVSFTMGSRFETCFSPFEDADPSTPASSAASRAGGLAASPGFALAQHGETGRVLGADAGSLALLPESLVAATALGPAGPSRGNLFLSDLASVNSAETNSPGMRGAELNFAQVLLVDTVANVCKPLRNWAIHQLSFECSFSLDYRMCF